MRHGEAIALLAAIVLNRQCMLRFRKQLLKSLESLACDARKLLSRHWNLRRSSSCMRRDASILEV
jgi:hypothetical protein